MLLSMHIGSKDRSSFTGPNTSNMTALKQSAAKLSLSVYRGTVSSGDGDDEEESGARARSRWPLELIHQLATNSTLHCHMLTAYENILKKVIGPMLSRTTEQ